MIKSIIGTCPNDEYLNEATLPCLFAMCTVHSMAMGNLNKSKETTQTATTALKVEDHYPLESKSLLLDQNLLA